MALTNLHKLGWQSSIGAVWCVISTQSLLQYYTALATQNAH